MKLTMQVTAAALILTFIMVFGSWAFGAEKLKCDIVGTASYYGFESGSRTATGERFRPEGLTAAMPSRRHLGERWRVTYRGSSVVVRINDVGPAPRLHRVIDLSEGAAQVVGLTKMGVATVCLRRLY